MKRGFGEAARRPEMPTGSTVEPCAPAAVSPPDPQRRKLVSAALGSPVLALLGAPGSGFAGNASSSSVSTPTAPQRKDAVLLRELIARVPPTLQSHASTLLPLRGATARTDELLAAWFGGTAEREPDVRIWLARRGASGWSAPVPVADGVQADGQPLPCWNPVLCQPREGPLRLFYKVGPDPQRWWGMEITSSDGGRRWSAPRRLPDGVLGPVRSKALMLRDGHLLSPSSTESPDGSWRAHFELSSDHGASWRAGPPVPDPLGVSAIQPTLVQAPDGSVVAYARCRAGRIAMSRSRDAGQSWAPWRLTDLPNPNAGIEVLGLADGRWLMVYNPDVPGADWWVGRDRLAVAVSTDAGRRWRQVMLLEDERGQEFSYPAAVQSRDGLVHLSYTARRTHISHVVIDPRRLG